MPKTHHQKSSLFRAKLRPLAAMSDLLSFGYVCFDDYVETANAINCLRKKRQCKVIDTFSLSDQTEKIRLQQIDDTVFAAHDQYELAFFIQHKEVNLRRLPGRLATQIAVWTRVGAPLGADVYAFWGHIFRGSDRKATSKTAHASLHKRRVGEFRWWLECLGPTAIPFDPQAKAALIKRARQKYPQLDRHLQYWEQTKRKQQDGAVF